MEGSIDFSEEVAGFLEKLASTQSLQEKPAAERLVAILKEKLHREPERLRRFSTALNQVLLQICNSDGDVVTVEQVPQGFLERVESILDGHDDLIAEFNSFLGMQNPKKPETAIDMGFLLRFVKKVRNCGELVYKRFLEIIKLYKLGTKMNTDELFSRMQATFYNHPDLEQEFAKIRSTSKATTRFRHSPDHSVCINTSTRKSREVVQAERKKRKVRDGEIEFESKGGKRKKLIQVEDRSEEIEMEAKNWRDAKTLKLKEQTLCFFGEVQQRLSCLMRYKDFLEQFFNYSNEKIQRAEFESRIFGLIGNHSDLVSEFQLLMKNSESDTMSCTPSYRLLNEDYPKHLASGEAKLEMEVLNDCWVSVPFNEGSSNPRQYSQKENMTFKEEDDRFEKDMMVGWFVSAIQFAEKKLLLPSAEGPSELQLRRCVEQLYGDHAYDVLRMIEKEPEKTLPVVQKRLKEKLEKMK